MSDSEVVAVEASDAGPNNQVDEVDKALTGDIPSGGQQVVSKLLVSNAAAGSVIGKAGATIEQIQRSSGARIQLSRAGEFYPGTSDRVILLSGSLHAVLTAVFLMLEKFPVDNGRGGKARDDAIKLAVSRKLCGAVIGQKGQTIRDFMQDSGATIRVQPLSELTPSDSERLVTISGARDKVLRAVALILNTLSADEKFSAYMDLTVQLAATQGLVPSNRTVVTKSALGTAKGLLALTMHDEDVGAILGKKGQTLTSVQQSAKVTIKISDRSKMDPDTHEREVSISGTYSAIQLACAMIAEKLSQNRPRSGPSGLDSEDDLEHDF